MVWDAIEYSMFYFISLPLLENAFKGFILYFIGFFFGFS